MWFYNVYSQYRSYMSYICFKKFIQFKLDHLKNPGKCTQTYNKTKVMITKVLSKSSAMLATNKVHCEDACSKIGAVI